MAATSDGASTNRRLVKIHDPTNPLVYKAPNPFAGDGREIYFFSDPPHLIKTTRNCWASKCRFLWVRLHSCMYVYKHMHVYTMCIQQHTCIFAFTYTCTATCTCVFIDPYLCDRIMANTSHGSMWRVCMNLTMGKEPAWLWCPSSNMSMCT